MLSSETLHDATADLAATERFTERRSVETDPRSPWHGKTLVVGACGCLGFVALAVLVIAVVTVSNDSTRPHGGRHPATTSVTMTPPPPPSPVPSSPTPVAPTPQPTEAQLPPTETSPAPVTPSQIPAATPSQGSPETEWPPRLRRWWWAHQHQNAR